MARGQVSDTDLATGLKGFGGFGSLGGATGRPVRDNPFRDTRAEPPRPAVVAPPPAAPISEPPPEAESPKLEVLTLRPDPEAEGREEPVPVIAAAPKSRQTRSPAPRPVKAPDRPMRVEKPATLPQGRENKTELYTERVTVLFDAELRDGAEKLAKDLHRNRTEKGERITANTVIRVALKVLLERVDGEEISVNNEAELLDSVRGILSGR